MGPRDRRSIHVALRDATDVATMSVGEGGYRQVMVVPEGAPEYEQARVGRRRLGLLARRPRGKCSTWNGDEAGRRRLARGAPRGARARARRCRSRRTQFEPLARYASLVLEWGARINLTGAKTPEALADEHLADALALLPHLPAGPFSFVDVGSGAGLPGLVVALLRADASGRLLEPIGKKQAFLAHAIRELGLAGRISARAERLEDHLRAGGKGAYDVAVSRAVWPVADWLERGLPLVKAGGLWIGLDGPVRRRAAAPDASATPIGSTTATGRC